MTLPWQTSTLGQHGPGDRFWLGACDWSGNDPWLLVWCNHSWRPQRYAKRQQAGLLVREVLGHKNEVVFSSERLRL